jgi:drug/metabolite transporter (DMT)-like permease
MNRNLRDLLLWIRLVVGAFCLATIALSFFWWVLLPRLTPGFRRGLGRIHTIAWFIIALGAVFVNALQHAFFGVNSTFLWAYVLTPVLYGLPIIASYLGLLFARKRRAREVPRDH